MTFPAVSWQSWLRNIIYEAQKGLSPVCDKKLEGRTVLEHSHVTGEPRGIVHPACNSTMAQVEARSRKTNYIISHRTEDRIRHYLKEHAKIRVD